ncbi:unnamed protein product [Brassica oleracea var. botrytis]
MGLGFSSSSLSMLIRGFKYCVSRSNVVLFGNFIFNYSKFGLGFLFEVKLLDSPSSETNLDTIMEPVGSSIRER